MNASREKLIIKEAGRLHGEAVFRYVVRSALIGFAAGVLLMWALEKFS